MDKTEDKRRGRFHKTTVFFRENWIFTAEIAITVLLGMSEYF